MHVINFACHEHDGLTSPCFGNIHFNIIPSATHWSEVPFFKRGLVIPVTVYQYMFSDLV